jgi:RNA polymerase sigma factor (sigma-70 family)
LPEDWPTGGSTESLHLSPGAGELAAVPSIGRATGVQRVGAPEADLTRTLYEQYANQIFRYCLHQLGSREEAEDAVQSTFLNAFRGIKRGVVPELESAWLFKIAHNVCLSRRRSSWRRGRIESPADFDVVEELTPAPSRHADELIGLQDVLEQMPENQRRAILLREWQGLSYHEIGEELELSQAAVETLIFRARRSLAQGLEQPAEPKRRRLLRGADFANVLAGLKSVLLGGSAAVKVAAAVAVVSATTVVAAAPVQQYTSRKPAPAAPAVPAAVVSHGHGATSHAFAPSRPATLRIAPGLGHTPEVTAPPSTTKTVPPVSPAAEPTVDTTPVAVSPPSETPPVATPPATSAGAPSQTGTQNDGPATSSSNAPPGQTKKSDPPASDSASGNASSTAPGQAKKDDPTSGPTGATPPVQAGGGNDNGNPNAGANANAGNPANAGDGGGNAKGK